MKEKQCRNSYWKLRAILKICHNCVVDFKVLLVGISLSIRRYNIIPAVIDIQKVAKPRIIKMKKWKRNNNNIFTIIGPAHRPRFPEPIDIAFFNDSLYVHPQSITGL